MAFQGNKINPTKHDKSQIKFYLILLPFILFALLPLIYVVSTAFKPINELFVFPPQFMVRQPTLDNFRMLFEASSASSIPVSRYLFNSVMITVTVMFLSITFTSLAGYVLSKHRFHGKNFIFQLNQVALMFIPIAVTIPRYLVMSKLGLIDTYWAHILPMLALPVGLFLLKQFIDQIPDDVIEAAKMDGGTTISIYFKVVLPMIKPALATVAILSFQTIWNSVEASTLFINDESLKTFAFYITSLSSTGGANVVAGAGISAAASLIMFLPNFIIFVILQKNVMSTMAYSGIK